MHSYTVEFRIVGQDLDPEEVTRTLGIKPTQVRRKGEARSQESIWSENMWSLDVLPPGRDDWPSLEEGLVALIEELKPIHERLKAYLPANKVFISCGHFTSNFNGGPSLSPALLTSLGEFGVELVLDTYVSNNSSS
jgi:hypothetical protein